MNSMNRLVVTLVLINCFFMALNASATERPEWARGAVWYQILPDRFRNSDAENDPGRVGIVDSTVFDWQTHPWASDWYKLQLWEQGREAELTELLQERRYGGDLDGIMEKLPYLKKLGVDILYLTPIFASSSVNKHDAMTFHHIDPTLGIVDTGEVVKESENAEKWVLTKSDELFVELLKETHKEKMKLVVEATFGFCSDNFWAFSDVRNLQAESAYKDWFEILTWDDPETPDAFEFTYKCRMGDKKRPLFRRTPDGNLVEPVKKYIFDCTKRWMDPNGDGVADDGVDGWSIVFSQDLPNSFWMEWNEHVRKIDADVITLREQKFAAKELSESAGFSLGMDNGIVDVFSEFLPVQDSSYSLSQHVEKLERALAAIPKNRNDWTVIQQTNYNLPRFSSLIVNSNAHIKLADQGGSAYFPYKPLPPDSTESKILELLTILKLTIPGSPMIYYGEESGMWGGRHPDNIKPMLWHEFDYEDETYHTVAPQFTKSAKNKLNRRLFILHMQLLKLRDKNQALQQGEYMRHILDEENGLLVFSRTHESDEVVVFLNFSNTKQEVALSLGWKKNMRVKELLSKKRYKLKGNNIELELKPYSARILVK